MPDRMNIVDRHRSDAASTEFQRDLAAVMRRMQDHVRQNVYYLALPRFAFGVRIATSPGKILGGDTSYVGGPSLLQLE